MRKLSYILFVTFLIILITSCGKDNSPVATTTTTSTTTTSSTVSTTGSLSGVGSLPAGVNGSIQNTRVALYTSVDDWNFDRAFAFTACDGNGNYTLANVTPGVYYVDAWKDNNNNQVWGDGGDYVWVLGSGVYPNYTLAPKQIPAGQVTPLNFEVFVVP